MRRRDPGRPEDVRRAPGVRRLRGHRGVAGIVQVEGYIMIHLDGLFRRFQDKVAAFLPGSQVVGRAAPKQHHAGKRDEGRQRQVPVANAPKHQPRNEEEYVMAD